MQRILNLFRVIAVIITILIIYGYWTHHVLVPSKLTNQMSSLKDYSKIKAQIHDQEYLFEVVNTQSSLTQGLSDRTSIGSDGMLFVFDQKARHSIWMLRMHFDLDLVWLDDNTIVQIIPHVKAPPPQMSPEQLPVYINQKPANFVLEIPSGHAKTMGLKVGDQVIFDIQPHHH